MNFVFCCVIFFFICFLLREKDVRRRTTGEEEQRYWRHYFVCLSIFELSSLPSNRCNHSRTNNDLNGGWRPVRAELVDLSHLWISVVCLLSFGFKNALVSKIVIIISIQASPANKNWGGHQLLPFDAPLRYVGGGGTVEVLCNSHDFSRAEIWTGN